MARLLCLRVIEFQIRFPLPIPFFDNVCCCCVMRLEKRVGRPRKRSAYKGKKVGEFGSQSGTAVGLECAFPKKDERKRKDLLCNRL